jgi:hypothetical protein
MREMRKIKGHYPLMVGAIFILLSLWGCKNESPIGKWKDGIVPYYLSGNFTNEEVAIIRKAMKRWESVANVTYKEVSPRVEAYKIQKVSANKWLSSIGENNSECFMIFGSGGNALSHVTHELGHSLGLLHEHQRPDRDKFVTVVWDKIISSYKKNFEIIDNPLIIEEKYEYDYHSIMHYYPVSFSVDGSQTLRSTSSDKKIDRLGIITETDAAKVREIYGPPRTDDE